MKRFWVILLAFCTVALSCVCVLVPGAEGTDTDIWSVYALKEDADGNPYFGMAPSYEYTEEGLSAAPSKDLDPYTIQTDHAYYLDNGIYMEIKLDRPSEAGVLVFHMWDQNGILISNFNCGSGWQGMLQLDRSESQFLISAFIHGTTPEEKGHAGILGSMKVNAPVAEDGSVTYSLHLKDGVLRINGSVVVGMDEALGYLREKRSDGSVYFGVSLIMSEGGGPIPVTVTRFGTSKEDSIVPGTGGALPETGEASPETIPSAPVETDPPEDGETDTVGDPDSGESDGPSQGGQDSTTPETAPDGSGDSTAPEDQTDGETDDPYGDPVTEPETRKEIHNEKVDDFMDKLEGVDLGGCGSAIGMGSVSFTVALAATYVGLRKKR